MAAWIVAIAPVRLVWIRLSSLSSVAASDTRHVVRAGVDHDGVDAAKAGEQVLQRRPDAGGLADIQRRKLDTQLRAVGGVELVAELSRAAPMPARGEAERVAATCHFHCQCTADARGSAGDDDSGVFAGCAMDR